MSADRPHLLNIADGQDLLEALHAAMGKRDGWLQATGHVEGVELRVAGTGADPRRSLDGRYTLASLSGPYGGPYAAVLARATGAGIETTAGLLVAARSAGVTAFFAPAHAERSAAPEPDGPAPAEERAPPAGPASGWAAQARAAAEQAQNAHGDDEDELDVFPERGDLVQHFAFGLCEVLRVNGDRLTLRDLRGPGRIREILTDMLSVGKPVERDGKRLFRLDRKT